MQIEKSQNSRPFHKLISIEFVCHGNICRSPMAEYILKDMVKKRGMSEYFRISSAATSTEEIGNPVHHGTRSKLRREGVPVGEHRAVRMTKEDYQCYDYLIGMDKWNITNMLHILGGDPEQKVCRLLDFTDHPRDIADPWYTGDFDITYNDICEGCNALLNHLEGR